MALHSGCVSPLSSDCEIIGATLPAENTYADLTMKSEDVATTGTDDATNDAKSVTTEVTKSHDNLGDFINQLPS